MMVHARTLRKAARRRLALQAPINISLSLARSLDLFGRDVAFSSFDCSHVERTNEGLSME